MRMHARRQMLQLTMQSTHANITDAAASSGLDTANSLPSADLRIRSFRGATRCITTSASLHKPSIAAIALVKDTLQ
jgi:AraC-like DNA-binding protein